MRTEGKEELVLKATRWTSNAPYLLKRLGVRCSSGGGVAERYAHTELAGKGPSSSSPRLHRTQRAVVQGWKEGAEMRPCSGHGGPTESFPTTDRAANPGRIGAGAR